MLQEIEVKEKMKRKNKKGVSEVIAYVLLIMLALSLSIGVYAFLKNVLWKEPKKCPDNLALVLIDYKCNKITKEINLTLQNKGLFNISGFLVRINNDGGANAIYYLKMPISGSDVKEIFFVDPTNPLGRKQLKPNEIYSQKFGYSQYEHINLTEIQPFIKEKKIILCDNIVRQTINNC